MQHIARVKGRINPNSRFFEMTATEIGGESRTANMDHRVTIEPREGVTVFSRLCGRFGLDLRHDVGCDTETPPWHRLV
jgi:hypothetical protein